MIEFSAVIHTYNRGTFLLKTLDAVKCQSYAPSEVIVIDDGSTDDTANRVRDNFPGFAYIKIDNSGCGAARKAGAECARKDWIAFCDDDDIWLPDHLERRVRLIERFPEAGFTCSNFNAFGPAADSGYMHFDGAPQGWWNAATEIREDEFVLINRHAFRHFLTFNPAYPLTWAVRRDVYHDVGGINARYSRWQAEDTDLSRRCALKTRVACDRRVTALYQRHGNNMSAAKARNFLSRAQIVLEQLEEGRLPKEYHEDAKRFISSSQKMAYLTSFWYRDFAEMQSIFRTSAAVRADWGLFARHVAAIVLSCLPGARFSG